MSSSVALATISGGKTTDKHFFHSPRQHTINIPHLSSVGRPTKDNVPQPSKTLNSSPISQTQRLIIDAHQVSFTLRFQTTWEHIFIVHLVKLIPNALPIHCAKKQILTNQNIFYGTKTLIDRNSQTSQMTIAKCVDTETGTPNIYIAGLKK